MHFFKKSLIIILSLMVFVIIHPITTRAEAQVATPTFSPVSGTYSSTQSVTLSCATSGATIYYTKNGSTPTIASTVYSSAISVPANTTIKALAVKAGMTNSAVGTAVYYIRVATPTFSPKVGTYSYSQSVTLSCATSGVTIYYTKDGSTPTTASTVYSGPITVSATTTIKALAVKLWMTNSAVATAVYTIQSQVATPVFSSPSGTYSSAQSVTLSCATSGATIYYTKNGSTPTTASTVYSGPITVSTNTTIKALAVKAGMTNSAVTTAVYAIKLPPKALASGFRSIITNGGYVWNWGHNNFGQLGDGTTIDRSNPVQVKNYDGSRLTNVKTVAAGTYHTVALKNDGTVWAWGRNNLGQLGDGTTTDSMFPVQVRKRDGSFLNNIVAIAAGGSNTLALMENGAVWTWGTNAGQFVYGTMTNSIFPVQVTTDDYIPLIGFIAIAAGPCHSLALQNDGHVTAWGDNNFGQLGIGGTFQYSPFPVYVNVSELLFLTDVKELAAGGDYSIALKKDGTLSGWGQNWAGQLGVGTAGFCGYAYPVRNADGSYFSNVTKIAAGDSHTMAIKSDGTLWGWGENYYGALGNGTTNTSNYPGWGTSDDSIYPAQVRNADGSYFSNATGIAAGSSHTLTTKSDGTVWAWGLNDHGQLGNLTTTNSLFPVQTLNSDGTPFVLSF